MEFADLPHGFRSLALSNATSKRQPAGRSWRSCQWTSHVNITESAHRIHNPITPEKLATLGAALRLETGALVLDLGSGSGEMLCTWARDHGVIGTGIDMSQLFIEQAKRRAEELGVAHQVKFIHGDAAGYVSDDKASVAASRTSRLFRPPWLRRRRNGSG
jgi:tRNA A58 N-methylase Trm61